MNSIHLDVSRVMTHHYASGPGKNISSLAFGEIYWNKEDIFHKEDMSWCMSIQRWHEHMFECRGYLEKTTNSCIAHRRSSFRCIAIFKYLDQNIYSAWIFRSVVAGFLWDAPYAWGFEDLISMCKCLVPPWKSTVPWRWHGHSCPRYDWYHRIHAKKKKTRSTHTLGL